MREAGRRAGEFLRAALRTALSAHVTNGLVAAAALLLISSLVHLLAGGEAAAVAMAGVIVVTAPDHPAPRRGKFTHFLPAVLLGTPLFFAVASLRDTVAVLVPLLMAATFLAFLCAAWGKRGLPIAASLVFAALFALASQPAAGPAAAMRQTLAFSVGAWLYIFWATAANALLNHRYRVLTLADALAGVAALMRAQALQFTATPQVHRATALADRLIGLQARLADELQGARNLLLEDPTAPRRLQLAGMLLHAIELRDHLVTSALDLDALCDAPGQDELLQVLGQEIQALAGDVEQLADALRLGRVPARIGRRRPPLAAAAAAAPDPRDADLHAPSPGLLARALARRVGHVHDEVLRLLELAARGERAPDARVVRTAWQLFVSPTGWCWGPLPGLWRRDAPPLRHGVRAALAIGTGYVVGAAIPWGSHATWILMTIAFVLRATLSQTLERRDSRVAGTLLGCVVAGTLLYAHVPPPVLLLAVALAHGIAHAFVLRRYLVTAVAATVLALLQSHLLNGASAPVFDVAERLLDTLLGVAIAWIFSYVLPSWERAQVAALLARALAAQARHAQLALRLGQLQGVSTASELAWRLARREAFDSLSALAQAVQRSLAEPRSVRPPVAELQRVLARSYQLLAQLTATKTMLLRRRHLVDLAPLQAPLAQAARTIAAALAPAAGQPAPPAFPSPQLHAGLAPWVLRRLRLAVEIADDLRADAARLPLPRAAVAAGAEDGATH
ncbi:FUSC family protein [Ramlibacter alkalitolerans]|uniref:FUSC family protein n=2 Tax=Ramlibacter alkalitolerans TaxID=2039631 RepID=A0ABS1JTA7_9BURK|nr:FUSC family protein [Ramlibacter alkalitolerans]